MTLPSGCRHDLLTPFDTRQIPGQPPALYPWRLMAIGDWFVVEGCDSQRIKSIRTSGISHAGYRPGHRKRFSVRRAPDLGPQAVICVRTH